MLFGKFCFVKKSFSLQSKKLMRLLHILQAIFTHVTVKMNVYQLKTDNFRGKNIHQDEILLVTSRNILQRKNSKFSCISHSYILKIINIWLEGKFSWFLNLII